MSIVRTVAPAWPVVTLEEARQWCRVDALGSPPTHEDDELIMNMCVQPAIDELDGVDGWLGRALVTQTWRMKLPSFPAGCIRLPLPPLQSVTGIVYLDRDGATQTLAPSAYQVIVDDEPGRIQPVYGTIWPTARAQSGSVAITFVAGYGAPSAVPQIIKNYILHRAAQSYAQREAVISGTIIAEVPFVRANLESIRYRGGWP